MDVCEGRPRFLNVQTKNSVGHILGNLIWSPVLVLGGSLNAFITNATGRHLSLERYCAHMPRANRSSMQFDVSDTYIQ